MQWFYVFTFEIRSNCSYTDFEGKKIIKTIQMTFYQLKVI